MYIDIKPDSAISIFQQIMDGIRFAILTGRLQPDEKLSSWRDLAVELRINPNTVAKAYQELEREKVLYVKRGEGTFVSGLSPELRNSERKRILHESFDMTISTGQKLQFDWEELRQEYENRLKTAMNTKPKNK